MNFLYSIFTPHSTYLTLYTSIKWYFALNEHPFGISYCSCLVQKVVYKWRYCTALIIPILKDSKLGWEGHDIISILANFFCDGRNSCIYQWPLNVKNPTVDDGGQGVRNCPGIWCVCVWLSCLSFPSTLNFIILIAYSHGSHANLGLCQIQILAVSFS